MAALTSRTVSEVQSTDATSGRLAPPAWTGARRDRRQLPEPHRAGPDLTGPIPRGQRRGQRDLLVGHGHRPVGLGHDERLQAEGIAREPEPVRGRREIAEAAVELADGVVQRLGERGARAELAPQVDADDLGVVLRVEADALLLVPPAELVVVRDVAVVD